jgi:methionyl-tRNA formyltransferase
MNKRSETVVFFGSGPVAAESLKLLAKDFEIEAVITKPKPPHHKGSFPVLDIAEDLNLKIILTTHKKDLENQFKNKLVKSKLGVVIDYGIIIPKEVIDYFPLGIVNSHFSILPKWRGADPISYAILNGDHNTGVSLMLIVEKLDEGPLLDQQSMILPKDMDSRELTSDLINMSNELLKKNLPLYLDGFITPEPQPTSGISYSSKLNKSDGLLDFNKTAEELGREVRAFIEWPRSSTEINEKPVIITKAHTKDGSGVPGSLYRYNHELGIYCSNGILIIDKLVPSGKREMDAKAYQAGYFS